MQLTLSLYAENGGKAILSLLLDYDWHATVELSRLAKQYNARIYELRRKGFVIASERKNGVFGYRLTDLPSFFNKTYKSNCNTIRNKKCNTEPSFPMEKNENGDLRIK